MIFLPYIPTAFCLNSGLIDFLRLFSDHYKKSSLFITSERRKKLSSSFFFINSLCRRVHLLYYPNCVDKDKNQIVDSLIVEDYKFRRGDKRRTIATH